MTWYRNNWYYVGGIIFVILAFAVTLFGGEMDPLRKIMLLSFMALTLHQFEEYVLPGGFPMCWNMGVVGEMERPESYLLNKKSAFVCNVVCMYPLYIAAIIWCEFYLLGLVTMYFHITQIIMHGIIINKKLHTKYNPGMGTIIFVMIPLGIYYICYIAQNCDVPGWNWWVAILLLPIIAASTLLLPMKIFGDKNSPYKWTEAETKKFNVRDKLAKIK